VPMTFGAAGLRGKTLWLLPGPKSPTPGA
jgi:hypothetical protein